MLIDLKPTLDKYGLTPTGVIQVGSHFCEEHEEFIACGIKRFIYIEPCKEAFIKMSKNVSGFNIPDILIFNDTHWCYPIYDKNIGAVSIGCFRNACGAEEKEMPMYVSHQNQGQSNSLLEPSLHLAQHPEVIFDDAEIVKVIPLDKLPIKKEDYDMLVMDVQGYEGDVLLGAKETLKSINIIYTEVNRGQTYKGNKEIEWMDGFLGSHGFVRSETFWPSPNWTWGDAIYIKNININI